ncbi:hypothetical protein N7539_001332 [Penicillium diatomitis]|uniref:Uncharacterized protein n=1 Tax=Penicillium diatomitis TaxID=2819901 RepID=A0A9W9XGL8_9EURO|nr:uncharacterized protein N7539_001332 [Penicillium diatomitis]KAJ5492586.1 hypothetical protein N7539_001332 [Penicillium diatomitis]
MTADEQMRARSMVKKPNVSHADESREGKKSSSDGMPYTYLSAAAFALLLDRLWSGNSSSLGLGALSSTPLATAILVRRFVLRKARTDWENE